MHVLYSFPTRMGTPGIGMTAWHQVRGLIDLGLTVTVMCGSCEKPLDGVHHLVETMRIGRVAIPYRILGLDRAMAWHDRRVATHLSRAGESFDLVHCWPSGSLHTLQVAGGLGLLRLLERPSSHTAQVYEVMARESRLLNMKLSAAHYGCWNEKRLKREEREFRLADVLLCPSESAAKTFVDRGYNANHLSVHQYGYDPACFSAPIETRAVDKPFAAVFVGECSPLKALHVALKAWLVSGAAESGRFLICGKFVAGYREALADLLRHSSIECMGFVPDVGKIMRQCDILVHSSYSEGSALVCYEAQACGLILLVSDAAGARCTHEVDGLVHEAGDVDTLASHLHQVSTDRAFAGKLREKTATRAKELTWSHAAERLHTIYSERLAAAAKIPNSASGDTVELRYA